MNVAKTDNSAFFHGKASRKFRGNRQIPRRGVKILLALAITVERSLFLLGVLTGEVTFVDYIAFCSSRFSSSLITPFTPPPVGGTGYCFRAISFFLSLFIYFVSLSATLRENGWTDLHEIFREGVE